MRARSPHPAANIAAIVSGLLRASAVSVSLLAVPVAVSAQARLTRDIPAQPLPRALEAFAEQTGLHLVYLSRVVGQRKSHAVSAGLDPSQALARLLQGTGLRFEALTPHSVRILEDVPPDLAPAGPADTLPDVTVTANRREEGVQDIPSTIQVLTDATLESLSATTLEDYVGYLPGVTVHGVGPAQNNIYIRGLATGAFANQAAGFGGDFPNVAIYLDEQSAQLPGRNLDVYAADLDRIEVLEGPQGTLFGAGAQAGVVRYITNKPRLNEEDASLNAGYATTAHGDPSGALDAVINLPVIPDTLAVRGVIYNERRGGYITNAPASFARAATDPSISYANYPYGCGPNSVKGGLPCQVPPNSPVINNAALVGRAINPVVYQGVRVSALYQFDKSWSALLVQSYQNMNAQGVSAEEAVDSLGHPQPDLTVQLFNPSYDKDRFENTALTIDGRAGELQLLYAAAYLVRNVQQVQDYTNYARGGLYVDYYQCANPGSSSATARCFSPSSTWRVLERNTHLSQEIRVSTPDYWRARGVGGLFYEDYLIQTQADWFYLTALPYFNPIAPPTGFWSFDGQQSCTCNPYATFVPDRPVTSINPSARPAGDGFFNDITRGYNQKAAYLSGDYDVIPQSLTLTLGTRYYHTDTREVGSLVGSFGCRTFDNPSPGPVPDPCINRESTNLNQLGLARAYSGFRSRANLSWRARSGVLVYYTWSQGFRAGTFGRGFFLPPFSSPLSPGPPTGPAPYQAQAYTHGGWTPPLSSAPDTLTNNEIGWKTRWLDERLQWNGALYQEDWIRAQTDPADVLFFGAGGATINGGNYRVRGLETSVLARPTRGLSIEVSGAWSHSKLVKQGVFYWADGTPINFATLKTETGANVLNPTGALGSPLAGAPPFQGEVRVRYEFFSGDRLYFAQVGAQHQSHSLASTSAISFLQTGTSPYELPPFTTLDGALGVGAGAWLAQIYGANLTDKRAKLYENTSLDYEAITVNRPRTIGLRVSYKFRGG
jgi:outer membrane receptor protein involved in Fe transport